MRPRSQWACLLATSAAIQVLLFYLATRIEKNELPRREWAAKEPTADINLLVKVDNVLINRMRSSFSCVTLDWWPADKCDYEECSWQNASILTANFSDPLLIAAVKALSPVILRVGGSLADQVLRLINIATSLTQV